MKKVVNYPTIPVVTILIVIVDKIFVIFIFSTFPKISPICFFVGSFHNPMLISAAIFNLHPSYPPPSPPHKWMARKWGCKWGHKEDLWVRIRKGGKDPWSFWPLSLPRFTSIGPLASIEGRRRLLLGTTGFRKEKRGGRAHWWGVERSPFPVFAFHPFTLVAN